MPTETTHSKEERPIYECVSPADRTWKNRYKNTPVTPPVPDFSFSSRNIVSTTFSPTFVEYFPGSEFGGLEPLAPTSPSCNTSSECATLFAKSLRQEPVRVHPTYLPPKSPKTLNLFGPDYH